MTNLKSYAAAALAFLTALGGLDAGQVTAVFPTGWGATIASILAGCAFVAHLFKGVSTSATPKPPDDRTPPQALVALLLLAAVTTMAMGMTSCVTTTAPDGTKTTSFAPTQQQLEAAQNLVNAIKSRPLDISLPGGPVYGPDPAPAK